MNYLAQFWPRLWHMIVSYLAQCWEAIQLAIGDFNIFRDTIDIALIAYIIYKGIQIIRETRASQLVKGILLLAGLYIVVYAAQLRTTLWLLKKIIEMGILIIFIVFQPELRSILERAGRTNLSVLPFSHSENSLRQATIWGEPIDVVCEAAQRLSITAIRWVS